jgi:hypothetical protein
MKNGLIVDQYGDKRYYLNDLLHREDGPAVELALGYKHWYQHGKRHRSNGPTIESPDGTKWWHQHGYLHRLDGPAIEYGDGHKDWYLHDNYINCSSQEEFLAMTNPKLAMFW